MKKLKEILKQVINKLETHLNKLRVAVPGLPGNRAIISALALTAVILLLLLTFQKILGPKEKFTTYTLPYEQNFDDVILRNWFKESGVWTIRDAALSQTVGGDTPAELFVPYKLIDDTPYHASVYITMKKDTRMAGLSFNAQYPDISTKQQRVYLSQPDSKSLFLISGYLDDTGSFITQVQVPLTVSTGNYRLDLYVYQNTYIVQLNGQRLIDNRPLFYKNGLVGFFTLGPAIFDTYKLTTAGNPDPGNLSYNSDFDQVPGGAGWVPFAGAWKIVDKTLEQTDTQVINAGIGYETSTFQNYTLRVNFSHLAGQGAGVLFNMPSPYQISGAQVVRYSDETDSVIWGYYDDKASFIRQGYLEVPHVGTENHVLQIFSGDATYNVMLDDKYIANEVPLQSRQGSVGLMTSASSAAYASVEVFPLFGSKGAALQQLTASAVGSAATPAITEPVKAGKTPADQTTVIAPTSTVQNPGISTQQPKKTIPPTSTDTGNGSAATSQPTPNPVNSIDPVTGGQAPLHAVFTGKLSDQNWFVVSGQWKFQNGNMVQGLTSGYDYTVINTKTKYSNYSFQVGFSQLQGSGAGLVFNMPKADGLSGATMVRYSDKRDNALVWGFFDDNGVYKNMGYAEVNHAGTDHHTLRVSCDDASFTIFLDDKIITQNVPYGTRQNNGFIGLLTSVSSVTYDEVTVDGIGAAFKGNYTNLDGFTDQRIISGKWAINNNKITQSVPDPADYVWNTGVQASNYTVTAKITLPKGSKTAGAGFILNMSERGTKNNAFIARLTNGGQGFWWGQTDEKGKFKGQGSINLSSTVNSAVVQIMVKDGLMSLNIDGKKIISDIKMSQVDGWIGLVSYGGPVTFEELKLEVVQ